MILADTERYSENLIHGTTIAIKCFSFVSPHDVNSALIPYPSFFFFLSSRSQIVFIYRYIFAIALSCLLFAEFWFCSLHADNRDSFL